MKVAGQLEGLLSFALGKSSHHSYIKKDIKANVKTY
jgi:hypothetical protein